MTRSETQEQLSRREQQAAEMVVLLDKGERERVMRWVNENPANAVAFARAQAAWEATASLRAATAPHSTGQS